MIGIFDSGVGGLTVVKEFKKHFPHLPFIYLGDNARMPYGSRGTEIIKQYASDDTQFLISHGATIILVACNTASAQAGEYLRSKYPAIKFFEVIAPASSAAAQFSRGKIGVIGTSGTINSQAYQCQLKKIRPDAKVFSQACPLFVPLVEQNWTRRPEAKTIARKYLTPLKMRHIDTLILGCTHYPLLRTVIQEKIGRRVKLIDPAEEVINAFGDYLSGQDDDFRSRLFHGKERYFATDLDCRFKEVAEKWLGEKINLEKAVW